MSRVPLRNTDLSVGQPAGWEIFDAAGNVVADAGHGLFAEAAAEDGLIISAFVFQQLVENKAS